MKEMKGTNKLLGLMFKKDSKPLRFEFEKPVDYPIHSLFCERFIAIWFLNNIVVDFKIVEPFKKNIKSISRYNKLVEIPI